VSTEKKRLKVLFYYLSAFSHTGGIEKFNRCFMKALDDLEGDAYHSSVVSVYDEDPDIRYNSTLDFKGFNRDKRSSLKYVLRNAKNFDVVVIGHINLAIAGVLIKLLNPRCRLVVTAHGIEVWKKLSLFKKQVLRSADMILAVSNYTKNQLVLANLVPPSRIRLFPNTIDPYFPIPTQLKKPQYLLDRYSLKKDQPVMLTLSRLLISERFKGYDIVIASLPGILQQVPDMVYVLSGKYDEAEKHRIEALIDQHGVRDHVLLTGFIEEAEVADHYMMADVFIMPSRKEGFGIVFLEALACGTNVIGGNQDGTVDALHNGSLGKLINPRKKDEITEAVMQQLQMPYQPPETIQKKVLDMYHFQKYRERLHSALQELSTN
jgi:phosphatidyl-myo-inositol dimannoside synthase